MHLLWLQFFKKLVQGGTIFVAKQDTVLVGFMEVKDGWLHHLYITPSYQGKGIGTLLLLHAKSVSPQGLQLWVFEQNEGSIRLYEREGFVLVEKRSKEEAANEEHLPDRRYMWQV